MVQWVKKLTEVACIAVEARVQSLAQCSGLKDQVLPQLCRGCSCDLDFIPDPAQGTSICSGFSHLKKKDKVGVMSSRYNIL